MSTQQQPQQVAPKESPVAKILGGFSWWINSLMGKPQASRVSPPTNTAPPPPPAVDTFKGSVIQPNQTVETSQTSTPSPKSSVQTAAQQPTDKPKSDDPIFQDFMMIKKLFGLFSGKVSETVKPTFSKGMASSSQAASSFVKTVDPGFVKKMLRIFIIIVVLIALAFIGYTFFNKFQENSPGGLGNTTPGADQTPTPGITFVPEEPSVYANDPVIVKLEEDAAVLVRELEGANIKETTINPPILDFNVTF